MSASLLLFVGAIYVVVAFDFYRHGQLGMALAFVSYAGVNVGFAWAAPR